MKRRICLLLAVMMMFSALVLPALALAQEVMHDDCECHAHAVGETVEPMAECRHEDWPYNTIYTPTRVGCYMQQRYYKVCTNCGEAYSWYKGGADTVSHLGPLYYKACGVDAEGETIYKRACKACDEFIGV